VQFKEESMHPRFRTMIPLLAVSLAVLGGALLGCGENTSRPGIGYLTVQVAFNGPMDVSAAGLATLSEDGRTPLADVILSFDAFEVVGACADTADTTDGDDGEDTTMVAAARLRLASEGDDEYEDEGDDCKYWAGLDSTVTISASGLDTTLAPALGTLALPAGWYDRINLYLVGAWVVTQDGDTLETHLPGYKNYLKINSSFHVDADEVTPLAIVFDPNRSVVESPPGSRNFHLKPVVHAHQGWYDHDDDHEDDKDQEGD
jgi:hypothetical protein